jgi:phage gp46-like protein
MSDLAIKLVDGCLNIGLREDGAALERDDGLETAVVLSLFTDQRVSSAELPAGEPSQRGWWGDQFADGDQIGSKLWLARRGKINNQTAVEWEARALASLNWMLQDGVAESVAVTSIYENGQLILQVEIQKPQTGAPSIYEFLWDGQRIKRG